MINFKEYKFPASEVRSVISSKKKVIPTETQTRKALNALSKDNLLTMTKTDIESVIDVINIYSEVNSLTVTGVLKSYLIDIFLKESLGISRLPQYSSENSIDFRLNGTRNEKMAIEILSRVDGVEYFKNRNSFEGTHFTGIPDVLTGYSVFEIKTRHLYTDFVNATMSKPSKSDFFQLQIEMDVAGVDEGQLIYVATGINDQDRVLYLDHCRESMQKTSMSEAKIEKKMAAIQKSCDLSWLPDKKRVFAHHVKRNPEFIKMCKSKATVARNFLMKIQEKFENL